MYNKFKLKPEEQLVVRKALDSAFLCAKSGMHVFTDFYDPKNVSLIVRAASEIEHISIVHYGGIDNSERVMLCFCKHSVADDSFPIERIFIDSSKFSGTLTHRDFLGALIGLGIDRGKIGDIVVEQGNAVVFIHKNMAQFVVDNLLKVGRTSVKASITDMVLVKEQKGKIIKFTVSSMRADAVIGCAYGLSRAKAKEIIVAEKLFINWSLLTNPSAHLNEGDVITVRGLGRSVIRNIGKKTKKDRIFLEIERWTK